MKWIKYFLQFAVYAGDIILVMAILTVVFGISHSLSSFIFFAILFVGAYKVWKKTGGLSHWRKEIRLQFYKNWDSICDGKTHIEIRNGEKVLVMKPKSHWNYRVIYHPPSKYMVGKKEFDREEYLAIHEVHYDEEGIPHSMTIDEIVTGDEGDDSLLSLRWIMKHQLDALDKPILTDELENGTYKEISQEKQNDFSKSIKKKKQTSSEDL